MAAILKSMEEGQWIRNGPDLWGLNERLWEKSPITEEYILALLRRGRMPVASEPAMIARGQLL